MPKQIRVLLVDDSVIVLHGLKAILEEKENIVVVATARTPEEAITVVRDCRPDVVVLDVRIGSASGTVLCETIRHTFPQTAMLFVTACCETDLLHAAIHAGAQGYLLKSCSGVDVARSVEIVAEGKAVIDPTLIPSVIAWIRDGAGVSRMHRMEECSRADYEVLSRIAAGKSNKEIAQELHATPNQIGSRIQAIYRRLKISRRSEATSRFVRWKEGLPCAMPNGTPVTYGSKARGLNGQPLLWPSKAERQQRDFIPVEFVRASPLTNPVPSSQASHRADARGGCRSKR